MKRWGGSGTAGPLVGIDAQELQRAISDEAARYLVWPMEPPLCERHEKCHANPMHCGPRTVVVGRRLSARQLPPDAFAGGPERGAEGAAGNFLKALVSAFPTSRSGALR